MLPLKKLADEALQKSDISFYNNTIFKLKRPQEIKQTTEY